MFGRMGEPSVIVAGIYCILPSSLNSHLQKCEVKGQNSTPYSLNDLWNAVQKNGLLLQKPASGSRDQQKKADKNQDPPSQVPSTNSGETVQSPTDSGNKDSSSSNQNSEQDEKKEDQYQGQQEKQAQAEQENQNQTNQQDKSQSKQQAQNQPKKKKVASKGAAQAKSPNSSKKNKVE